MCKCGLLPPRTKQPKRKNRENPIKLFIAFRFVRFFLITIRILTFQLFFSFSSSSNFLTCPLLTLSGAGVTRRRENIFYGIFTIWLRFHVVKSKPIKISWLKLEDCIGSQQFFDISLGSKCKTQSTWILSLQSIENCFDFFLYFHKFQTNSSFSLYNYFVSRLIAWGKMSNDIVRVIWFRRC